MSKITFSQAMQGYLLAIGARHLSEHTLRDYVNTFKPRQFVLAFKLHVTYKRGASRPMGQ